VIFAASVIIRWNTASAVLLLISVVINTDMLVSSCAVRGLPMCAEEIVDYDSFISEAIFSQEYFLL